MRVIPLIPAEWQIDTAFVDQAVEKFSLEWEIRKKTKNIEYQR